MSHRIYREVRDDVGLVGRRPLPLGHVYDPSYSTRPGQVPRCVCGRPRDHVFHRHIVRTAG